MNWERTNRISGVALIVLSLVALLSVLSGYLQDPQPDEGAAAHIFQLSVMAALSSVVLFLITANWGRPLRIARVLSISGAALAPAFAALYYLEHFR